MDLDMWILFRLVVAAALTGFIGINRQRTGKDAGLRTHMLVGMGSALFVSFGDLFIIDTQRLTPPGPAGNFRLQVEPLSTVQAIVTGVSFLGAGTIFVSGRHDRVKGLTTAASIWVTAAVGIAVGLDRYIIAVGSTLLIYFTLWLANWTEQHLPAPSASGKQPNAQIDDDEEDERLS